MPNSPPTICPCGGRRQRGQPCPRCGRGKRRESRSAEVVAWNNRTYGRRWREFAQRYLELNPLCLDCEAAGIVTAATDVHHYQKVKDRPDLQYTESNLRPLCRSCHSRRTSRGE